MKNTTETSRTAFASWRNKHANTAMIRSPRPPAGCGRTISLRMIEAQILSRANIAQFLGLAARYGRARRSHVGKAYAERAPRLRATERSTISGRERVKRCRVRGSPEDRRVRASEWLFGGPLPSPYQRLTRKAEAADGLRCICPELQHAAVVETRAVRALP